MRVIDRFRGLCGACEESIKYGGVVFSVDGKLIGGVFPYSRHVSVEFSHGAEFDDPEGILTGSGKHRRHIIISHDGQPDEAALDRLIRQAVDRG